MTFPVAASAYKRYFPINEWTDDSEAVHRLQHLALDEYQAIDLQLHSAEWVSEPMAPTVQVACEHDYVLIGSRIKHWRLYAATSPSFLNLPSKFVTADNDTKSRFDALTRQWKQETLTCSSADVKFLHPAHMKIIGMGTQAISWILQDLRDHGGLWFLALESIADENPVPEALRGRTRQMKDIWLEWGVKHGHITSQETGTVTPKV